MLASLDVPPLTDPQLVYEPKYDGIRAVVEVAPGGSVHLWSRLGNEKTGQFPAIARALLTWGRRLKAPVVLDGEVVALDGKGQPIGFQHLQRGREHDADTAFIAFDLLKEGRTDFRNRPLVDRRRELERLFGRTGSPILRISDVAHGDGRALYEQAVAQGWEGLIAKYADSRYKSGKRTPAWRKLKIVRQQEFVIGGWTEPRNTRDYFGSLLLGVYEPAPSHQSPAPSLTYVGHVGTGFDHKELARVMKLLKSLEISDCPFRDRTQANEKAHWVRPELVAQVKFLEWTADGRLRHPVYLGLRDDKKPEDVQREEKAGQDAQTSSRLGSDESRSAGLSAPRLPALKGPRFYRSKVAPNPEVPGLVDQLRALEESRRDGLLRLADGDQLKVTNLHKPFWPKLKLTKGDLMRYYVQVAPFILPAVADRALVMKRFPNGIDAKPFYQHRVADVPSGVRVETVSVVERRPQIIGGDLKTLLYTTQLAAISQDPWFSRVSSPQFADYVALDLDPSAGVSFDRVLDVARWIRDELDAYGALGVPKTSGADGLHVYVPLPPETPYEAGLIFCQIIATVVSQKHANLATVERAVKARGRRVYIDYLQNVLGKTLASAYSARASRYAGVSAPLSWQEIDEGVTREDFTIETIPARLKKVGDLWKAVRASKGVDLSKAAKVAGIAALSEPRTRRRRS
jgi:bifunctional non-homologous end joining protein LigD